MELDILGDLITLVFNYLVNPILRFAFELPRFIAQNWIAVIILLLLTLIIFWVQSR